MVAVLAAALTLFTIGSDGAPLTPVPVVEAGSEAPEDPPQSTDYSTTYPLDTVWIPLAQCESSGRWHLRGRIYSGGLQMDATFWARYGGRVIAPTPADASMLDQVLIAERGQKVQGWLAWPVCSRIVGLR